MAKPLIAIVGRPNVGKSYLFNRIVGQRLSIVEDTPGVTRDRLYASGDWSGRVFDIVDTGGSIDHLMKTLAEHEPASVEVATLLFKPASYTKHYNIKYPAMKIPNDFILGFGLDYDELGRNLRDIYILADE